MKIDLVVADGPTWPFTRDEDAPSIRIVLPKRTFTQEDVAHARDRLLLQYGHIRYPIAMSFVKRVVAEHYNVPIEAIGKADRRQNQKVVLARSVVMYLGRVVANHTSERISQVLGFKDPAATRWGYKRIRERALDNTQLQQELLELQLRVIEYTHLHADIYGWGR